MCEVEISCVIPIDGNDISKPRWDLAPIVQRSSIVSAGNVMFELTEDVDFSKQFNSEGYSNRRFVPSRDSNGSTTRIYGIQVNVGYEWYV